MERRHSPRAPSVHIHPMIQPQVPPSALALPRVQRLGSAGRPSSAGPLSPSHAHSLPTVPGGRAPHSRCYPRGSLDSRCPPFRARGAGVSVCVCVCVVGGRVECILTTKQGVSCHYHRHWVSTAHSCPQREGPAKKKVAGARPSRQCPLLAFSQRRSNSPTASFLPSLIHQ